MSDKDLRIQITTAADTSGADAAAAALGKVEAATKAADGGGVDISELNARLDVLRERTKALQENAGATEELGEKANTAAPKLDKMIGMGRAMAAGQAAQALKQVSSSLRELSKEFQGIDPAIQATLENTAQGMESFSNMMGNMAMGFMAGGPVGAALAGLATGIGEIGKEWIKLEQIEAQGKAAVDASNEHLAAKKGNFDAFARADGLQKLYSDEKKALEDLIRTLDSANKMAASKARADGAQRDLADYDAIAGGAEPERVRIQRAQDDAATAKAKIDEEYRQAQAKAAAADKAFTDAERALKGERNTENDPRTIADLTKAVADARAQYENLEAARYLTGQIGIDRKKEIDSSTALKVRQQQEALRDRYGAANQSVEPYGQAAQDADDALRNQASAAKRAAAAGVREANELSALGQSAAGLPEAARQAGARPDYVADLSRRVNTLTTNPSRGAEKELHALVDQLLKYAEGGNAQFQAFHNRLAQLERARKLDSR